MTTAQQVLFAIYLGLIALVCTYGLHRYWLVYLYYKHQRRRPQLQASFAQLPVITVQLPMFNEQHVAERIIESACRLDYPRDRLEIQVLDDSTDETTELARCAVEQWRARGFDIHLLHRSNRVGFKAGALAEGVKRARGEFIAIFDADFVPPPDVLQRAIHHFTDDKVAMVQTRWEHLNRDSSLLTAGQAILLDGHFVIEHGARNTSGRFISFNGTAGIWRKAAIIDAGGWHHDTLTEDLDLSYRVQMRGWRFIYLPDLASPAELPEGMLAYKAQQYRWTKGGVQVCRKMLGRVLRSKLPLYIKVEAFFHLTSPLVYIYVVGLTLLLFPCLYFRLSLAETLPTWQIFMDLLVFGLATLSASTFYMASQRELFRTWADKVKYLPYLVALGVGIAFNNAKAAIDGLFGPSGEFVRTPKSGNTSNQPLARRTAGLPHQATPAARGRSYKYWYQVGAELAVGLYLAACLIFALQHASALGVGIGFVTLFMAGYLYVGGLSLAELIQQQQAARTTRQIEPAAATNPTSNI